MMRQIEDMRWTIILAVLVGVLIGPNPAATGVAVYAPQNECGGGKL